MPELSNNFGFKILKFFVADLNPGTDALLTLDTGSGAFFTVDPGSGVFLPLIRDLVPFLPWIRDVVPFYPGSGINIPDPRHCYLQLRKSNSFFVFTKISVGDP